MKSSERFNRLTEERFQEMLEEVSKRKNLPIELLIFNYAGAAEILCISVRTLKKLKKERKISYSQIKPRARVSFSAQDLIDYINSTKINRI